nr:MAG TPA: hypothetical protein [Bacteriophage sp.]
MSLHFFSSLTMAFMYSSFVIVVKFLSRCVIFLLTMCYS